MDDAQLYLPRDVFVCVTQGHGVFLDLRQDKYSAVMFPPDAFADTPPNAPRLAELLADQRVPLLEAGVLTTDPQNARAIEPTRGEPITGHIFGLDDQRAFGLTGEAAQGLNIALSEALDFFLTCWKASRDLKHRHIANIVNEVRVRKARAGGPSVDLEKVRRLTAVFRRLRPWYPRKYVCLYDSLALVEFLSRRNVYPLWVFAVQAQPFGAHCWVQRENLLLNEGSEYAGQFTPIMAI